MRWRSGPGSVDNIHRTDRGRHRSGSDIDLCLEAPALGLAELLLLAAELDDLLLPWRFDLQLKHLIDHPNLLEHIARAGVVLWEQPGAS